MTEPYGIRTEHRSYMCLLTFHEYFWFCLNHSIFMDVRFNAIKKQAPRKMRMDNGLFWGYCVKVLDLAVNISQFYALAILLTLVFNTSTRVFKELDVFLVAYLNLSVSKTNITALGKCLLHNYFLYSKNFFPIRKQTSLFVQLQFLYPV